MDPRKRQKKMKKIRETWFVDDNGQIHRWELVVVEDRKETKKVSVHKLRHEFP